MTTQAITPKEDLMALEKEDVVNLLRNKEREMEELRNAMLRDSFTPAVFMEGQGRILFWKKVEDCDQFSDQKFEMTTKFQQSLQEQISASNKKEAVIRTQELEIDQLKRQIQESENIRLESSNIKLRLEESKKMYDEIKLKNYNLERELTIVKEDLSNFKANFDKLEGFLKKSKKDYDDERVKLRMRLKALAPSRQSKKGLQAIVGEYRATEIFYSKDHQHTIEQILLRFNTIAVDSEKYLELLSLIMDFHTIVNEELAALSKKVILTKEQKLEKQKSERLKEILVNIEFYKNYIKGIYSKDPKVFEYTINFLIKIGKEEAQKNITLFEDEKIIAKLCESLRKKEEFNFQKSKVEILLPLIEGSEIISKNFVILGGVQVVKGEICGNYDPIFINSEYYANLLHLLKNVLKHNIDVDQLMDKQFLEMLIKFFQECYNKDSLYYLLRIVYYLSQDKQTRLLLNSLKIFTYLLKFYKEAWQDKNYHLLFHVFLLFSTFTRENSFKVQLTSQMELQNSFTSFFEPFKEEHQNYVQLESKVASLEIIRNLVLLGPSKEVKKTLVASGYLKSLLMKCFDSKESSLRSIALDCLISVTDLVVERVMTVDDIIINLDQMFINESLENQSKLLLFVDWALLAQSFNVAHIRVNLIRAVIDLALKTLSSGEVECFRRASFFVFLLMEREYLNEIILASQFVEKYLTNRVASNKASKRAWLMGLAFGIRQDIFQQILETNTNLVKFIWIEMAECVSSLPLEVFTLMRSSFEFILLQKNFFDIVFISKMVNSFMAHIEEFVQEKDMNMALELFYLLTDSPNRNARDVYVKNKEFMKFLGRAMLTKSLLTMSTILIYKNLITTAPEEELGAIVTEEFKRDFKEICRFKEDLGIANQCHQIYISLKSVNLLYEADLENMFSGHFDPKAENQMFLDYDPREFIIERQVDQMVRQFIRQFQN